jgi:hypothetical protein
MGGNVALHELGYNLDVAIERNLHSAALSGSGFLAVLCCGGAFTMRAISPIRSIL